MGLSAAPGFLRVMSFSQLVFDRYQARRKRRVAAACAYAIAGAAYLAWRATIFSPDSVVLSALYFTAEALGYSLGLLTIFCSWRYLHHTPKPALRGRSVDVFVPTYREPVSLVRWTLIAAKEISYPHQTFLLDDGNRPEMKALAEEMGVIYLAREKNIGAKAGNLNNGLANSTAEFVMVLDADHIAMPHALDVTLGFFEDRNVALVQTPEDFYNIDAFQFFNARRSRALWHDQSFFYTLSEPSRAAFSGASCIGTGVVYRRSALDAIGGIPAETVTEDMHTSLKLHKAGYETLYLNEPIAYGVASADIGDYYNTRHRWTHGNLHCLRHEKVVSCSKLTVAQKLSYLSLGLISLEGWQQILLFLVPIGSLALGLPAFDITPLNVLIVLFFPLLSILLLQEIGSGLARLWANEIYSMARFPVHIVAAAGLFADRMAFRASSKSIRGRVEWKLLLPQFIVIAGSLVAFGIGVAIVASDFKTGQLAQTFYDLLADKPVDLTRRLERGYSLDLLVISGFWAIFNALKGAALVSKAITNARNSHADFRFDTDFVLEIETGNQRLLAHVDRMSKSWLSLRVPAEHAAAFAKASSGELYVPSGSLPIHWRTQRISSKPQNGFLHVSGNLIWSSTDDQDRLLRTLYSVDWRREFIHRTAFFLTPSDVISSLWRFEKPWRNTPEWWPALCSISTEDRPHLAVLSQSRDGTATMITFRDLPAATQVQAEILGKASIHRAALQIESSMPLVTLGRIGLDGARVRKLSAVEKPALAALDQAAIQAVRAGAAE